MISVIIPTYNRNDLLKSCLDLIFEHNPAILDNHEVIVTDDSADNIAKPLVDEFFPLVKWIEGPKKGPAANRNYGAKVAKADWFLFLDDDCLPQKGWFVAYIDAIKASDENLVYEGYTFPDRPKERFDEETIINVNGNKLHACNFAIKRQFFEQLNGFDETFPFAAMEDVDFLFRVTSTTHLIFLPGAFVIHPWRRIKPFKKFGKSLKSHRVYARKHGLLNLKFRWDRTKIFGGKVIYGFIQLKRFSFRGWPIYLERCLLNFCLIFII